jgi:hypothetical protein
MLGKFLLWEVFFEKCPEVFFPRYNFCINLAKMGWATFWAMDFFLDYFWSPGTEMTLRMFVVRFANIDHLGMPPKQYFVAFLSLAAWCSGIAFTKGTAIDDRGFESRHCIQRTLEKLQ